MSTSTSSAAGGSRQRRRARGSLSEEEILDAALELVMTRGFGGLSMPALARQLGSGVTSIYWYFRSKEELLAALAERVVREARSELLPIGDGPWREVLVDHLLAMRQLLEDRPGYREILARSFLFDAAAPTMFDDPAAAARLVEADGFAPADAVRVVEDLATYTRGFIVLQHRLEADDTAPQSADRLRHVEAGTYPMLGRLPDFVEVMWLGHEQCAYGLRLLVAGIRSGHGG